MLLLFRVNNEFLLHLLQSVRPVPVLANTHLTDTQTDNLPAWLRFDITEEFNVN